MSDKSPNGKPEARPYISRLTVSGFKSIRHAELELGRLNVLIGANGSGKSNLAALLRLLRAQADDRVDQYVVGSGGASSLLHFGVKRTEDIDIRCSVRTAASAYEHLFEFEWSPPERLVCSGEVVQVGDQIAYVNRHSVPPELIGAPGKPLPPLITITGGWGDGDEPELNLERIIGWSSRVGVFHFNDTSLEGPLRRAGDRDNNVELFGDGRNLAAFLYKLQEVRPQHFQFLTKVVRLVAPFFDRFVLRPNELQPRAILLRWREVGADDDFGVHLLSDGTLRFIALAALLSQPKDELPSLIFVDEPEIGLHPAALRHIVGLIKSAALHTQVVVATQSPEMLDQFDPTEVIVTERHDGATEFNRLDPDELKEWLEEYSLGELWDKNVIGGRPAR